MSDTPQSPFTAPQTPEPAASAGAGSKKTSGMAVAALVIGILSMLGFSILIVPTILAIVLGHIAYARIRKDPNLKGEGIAIAGFVLGYVSIFSVFVIGLLAAMAIPAFQKVRDASLRNVMHNDARQIASAAQQYMLEHGERPVVFQIDPVTGAVTGPLSEFNIKVTPGTRPVDGLIENSTDTFSLTNPRAANGGTFVFDAEGKTVSEPETSYRRTHR